MVVCGCPGVTGLPSASHGATVADLMLDSSEQKDE